MAPLNDHSEAELAERKPRSLRLPGTPRPPRPPGFARAAQLLRAAFAATCRRGRRGSFAVVLAVAGLVTLTVAAGTRRALRGRAAGRLAQPQPIALSALIRLLGEGRIRELTYSDGGALLARLRTSASTGVGISGYTSHLLPGSEVSLFQAAQAAGTVCRYTPAPRGAGQVLSVLFPFLLLLIWYRALRSLLDRNEKFSGPSDRKRRAPPQVTLADVVCSAKVELAEIVDYLNHPAKYRRAGARLPRGALLVGPSGTGKTLLARAVAGEARCPFIATSASEFVEVYVGRGAARVRDLFRQAREAAPAVLFFDEIDALGSRSRGGMGANEEYVQTLNQLLTELDGFHGHSDGLVVLAATNRREALDPALLRPGRFDRHVTVGLPTEEERLRILELHALKASAAQDLVVSGGGALRPVAAASDGLSGAELANVVNEAVFLALRAGRAQVAAEDLATALSRCLAVRCEAGGGGAGGGGSTPLPTGGFGMPRWSRNWPTVVPLAATR